jgi:hypothetical protein
LSDVSDGEAPARSFRLVARTVGIAVWVVVAGCATLGGITKDSSQAKREAVMERANARWRR